jgi:hypothetical protein
MGIFIQGCPPVASDILEALEGKEDLERDGGLNHPMGVSYGIDDKK